MDRTDYWRKQREEAERRRQEGLSNLQSLCIRTDGMYHQELSDYSYMSQDRQTDVYFRDIEQHLIKHIKQAKFVLGCVAWLTSEPILAALASLEGVSIIVQKEDFLRPDLAQRPTWARRLRSLYECLPDMYRETLGETILSQMNRCGDSTLQAVRCVGNYNAEKKPAFPRSHHKFVLFCREEHKTYGTVDEPYELDEITPYAVWTGSFNFTKTAGASFENALVLRDPKIVQAFYHEYAQVAALSEPLDWETQWSESQWRIGT